MATGLVLAIGCGGLAGCVSTQQKNARAQLVAERTLGGRRAQPAVTRSHDVQVTGVALVRAKHGGALVVALRNRGARALTDVPVAVGVRGAGGRRTRLNGGGGLDWFQSHVPAIGAGETTTWVYTTRRTLPAGRPWAIAGATSAVGGSAAVSGALPQIGARALPASGAPARGAGGRGSSPAASRARAGNGRGESTASRAHAGDATTASRAGDAVRVALVNDSDVPQYALQVYAVVRDGDRVVAAGKTTVVHLGTRERASARVALFGAPGPHTVRAHALPTIFD